jgi:HicB-like protein involved in pilus formation
MRRSNFALRLQPSLLEEARKAAEAEGVALNQLINVAVAEKISALRTQEYFAERARRANRKETFRILDRAGRGNPPMPGDDLPSGVQPERKPARKAVSGIPATRKPLKKKTQKF